MQKIVDLYRKLNRDVPDEIIKLANTSIDPDTQFNEMLNHDLWKNTSIPEYDVHHSHMPDGALVDPEDPSSWFNFFWIDEDMDYFVKETNIYIEFKNQNKSKNAKIIKPTNKAELKKFMGVCMYMATFKLAFPRSYWIEKISLVVESFTVNRFEELRSSINFNSAIGSATTTE